MKLHYNLILIINNYNSAVYQTKHNYFTELKHSSHNWNGIYGKLLQKGLAKGPTGASWC
jgi:hypothetical protein